MMTAKMMEMMMATKKKATKKKAISKTQNSKKPAAKKKSRPKKKITASKTLRFRDGTPVYGTVIYKSGLQGVAADDFDPMAEEGYISHSKFFDDFTELSKNLDGLPHISIPEEDIITIRYEIPKYAKDEDKSKVLKIVPGVDGEIVDDVNGEETGEDFISSSDENLSGKQ